MPRLIKIIQSIKCQMVRLFCINLINIHIFKRERSTVLLVLELLKLSPVCLDSGQKAEKLQPRNLDVVSKSRHTVTDDKCPWPDNEPQIAFIGEFCWLCCVFVSFFLSSVVFSLLCPCVPPLPGFSLHTCVASVSLSRPCYLSLLPSPLSLHTCTASLPHQLFPVSSVFPFVFLTCDSPPDSTCPSSPLWFSLYLSPVFGSVSRPVLLFFCVSWFHLSLASFLICPFAFSFGTFL